MGSLLLFEAFARFIKRLFQKSRISEQREWINQIKDLPKTQRLLCRDPIGNQKDRLPNQKSKLHQILVVPPEGRDAPAKPSERGEASPHAPTSSPEPAAALRSDPSKGRLHCELTLSLRSVRTLPIGRLHCTSLTVCAGSRGGFSPQFCSANEPPSGIRASFP